MSLRSNPRDVVGIQKFAARQNSMGSYEYVADGEPLSLRCNVYPLTATESETLGLVNSESRAIHLHQGAWPADQHSQITFDGGLWEQVGPVIRYTKGRATRHARIIIRWTGAAHPADRPNP